MREEDHNIWVKQLREGSNEAFTRLYFLYVDQLYGYALKLTKSPSDASDIVQETFLRVWERRKAIAQGTSFKSYLFQISYHLAVDFFRSKIDSVEMENYISSDHYQQLADHIHADDQITLDEYLQLVEQTLSRFSQRQQEIYRLSREEGFSSKEIGEQLRISEKTVNNQLSIVLSALKDGLTLYALFIIGAGG